MEKHRIQGSRTRTFLSGSRSGRKRYDFATAQKKDVLAIATDSDFAMLTGKMVDIEALRKQGVKDYFATKSNLHLPSFGLLEKRAYGETWVSSTMERTLRLLQSKR